jgi:aldose sugar dehydrogenase
LKKVLSGMTVSQFLYRLALSSCLAGLVACSGGDASSDANASDARMDHPQSAFVEQLASTAPSLPAPAAAEAPPAPRSIPPAPTDGPPPRKPAMATTASAPSAAQDSIAPSVLRHTVVTGLRSPSDLAFTIDGVLYYTERSQGLYAQRPGHAAVAVFTPGDLAPGESASLSAMAIDPDFSRNRFVFVLMKSAAHGRESSRVVRLTMDESQSTVRARRDILVVDSPQARAGDHNAGGTLRFGPDGYLYVSLAAARPAPGLLPSQDLTGKILRIDREGRPAAGNKPPLGQDGRVFAFGLSHPIALAFHAHTEAALVAQRQEGRDDITLAKAGANVAHETPTWRTRDAQAEMSSVERLRGPGWGPWRNALVVTFDRAQRVELVKLDAQGRAVQATTVLHKLGVGFKAVAEGPDGLYVITSGKAGGEEIWRLSVQ